MQWEDVKLTRDCPVTLASRLTDHTQSPWHVALGEEQWSKGGLAEEDRPHLIGVRVD